MPVERTARVCPFCGSPPGAGVFCEACGRNLAQVEQLPTRAEWEGETPAAPPSGALADRCAAATAAFLTAMHAAGDPGAAKLEVHGSFALRRRPHGWVLRPVRRTNEDPHEYAYEPGLVLTTKGDFHRMESEVRGWGQVRFPVFADTADPEPIEMPVEERLLDELAAVLRDNEVG